MKTTITSALALLLFAGASTAALAQDREHDRGGANGQPQVHQGGPHGGPGGQAPAQPPGAPHAAPAAPGAPAGQPFQGRNGRFGAPPASSGAAPMGAAPQADRGGQRFRDGAQNGGRFGRDAGAGGERRFQGGGPQRDVVTPGDRRGDRAGAPNVVIPPGGGERGWDRQRDGRQAANPNWQSDGRGSPHWGRGEHWERGRLPPVFWSQSRYRLGAYRAPYGYYVRDWGYGDFLPRGWYGDSYFLGDFLDFDLPYPPPGYEWVRVGGDAIMVDRFTGRIVQVVRGIFW
jgi:Ni/Co efflux regulator RcnB